MKFSALDFSPSRECFLHGAFLTWPFIVAAITCTLFGVRTVSVSQPAFVGAVIARCSLKEHYLVWLRLSVSDISHCLCCQRGMNTNSISQTRHDLTKAASVELFTSTGKKIEAISWE